MLIDMALSRIQSGAKEINLAASVEYLRDHRPHMVKTKLQFEFALSALVEETHAMLDAARQRAMH
jgi:receptor-type tyrosine-protein phosphatase N